MIYSKTLWFFFNEAEQEEGPFDTKEEAIEAEKLYAKYLNGKLTPREQLRLKDLYTKVPEGRDS